MINKAIATRQQLTFLRGQITGRRGLVWDSLRNARDALKRSRNAALTAWRRIGSRPVPGVPDQIHLSWQQDPSTSLTVIWHTPSHDNPAVMEYREAGTDAWSSASGITTPSPGLGALHRVTLTQLSPASAYEYRVSSDRGVQPAMSEPYRARTAPQRGSTDFRFAFIADTGISGRRDGNTTGTRQIIEEVLADQPLFVLGGGDYAYANRDDRFATIADAVDAWFEQMQPLFARSPFMAQYGNHEIFLHERYADWAPRFAHPVGTDRGKNYSFDVGDAHFTGLFVPGPPPQRDQLAWLDRDLAGARRRGLRWLIVYQHEPIYGHGHSHPAKPALRRVLAPILERHRVDLHLSAHDQNYERTYPLVGVPNDPTSRSTSRDSYEAGQGVVYAKVSPSGKQSEIGNRFSRFTTPRPPFIAVRDDTAHHYALITVRKTEALEVEVYSVVRDGVAKTLLDRFRIAG